MSEHGRFKERGDRHWQHAVFGCCDNGISIGAYSCLCCPCLASCHGIQKIDPEKDTFKRGLILHLIGCAPLAYALDRKDIRERRQIPGNVAMDACLSLCCPSCVASQNYQEGLEYQLHQKLANYPPGPKRQDIGDEQGKDPAEEKDEDVTTSV